MILSEGVKYKMCGENKNSKKYMELNKKEEVKKKCNFYLEDYNNDPLKSPMDLVLFDSAIINLARICRILILPSGHGVMIGNGGSGRKSLITLAIHIMSMKDFKIELKKMNKTDFNCFWYCYLQLLLVRTGFEKDQTVFTLLDKNICYESMLEDVSNLLNNGEVPNLYDGKIKIKIPDQLTNIMKNEYKKGDLLTGLFDRDRNIPIEKQWNVFVENVKTNLHIMLVQSPSGDDFRFRMRTFPSLINCANLNWFHAWPNDALLETAKFIFADLDIDATIKKSIISIATAFHQSVKKLSIK